MKKYFKLLFLITFLVVMSLLPLNVLYQGLFPVSNDNAITGDTFQELMSTGKSTLRTVTFERDANLQHQTLNDQTLMSDNNAREKKIHEYDFDHNSGVNKVSPVISFDGYGLLNSSLLVTHDPIVIDGNSEFESLAQAEGWSGNGTSENPYVIENYNLTSTATPLILIKNTNLHFILKNNLLTGSNGDAIVLENVTNGMVVHNDIVNNGDDGIYFDPSTRYVVVANNTISRNGGYGINAFKSFYHQIKGNLFSDNVKGGMYLHGEKIGTLIFEIGEINITENVIVNNTVGIFIQYASEPVPGLFRDPYEETIIILNTTFINNSVGVIISTSTDVRIVNATIIGNAFSKVGVKFESSVSNTLNRSIIVNYPIGIHISKAGGVILNDNLVSNATTWDVLLENSGHNVIYNNQFEGSGLFIKGLFYKHYYQEFVFNNTVSGKPLLYYRNLANSSIKGEVGQVILLNVKNFELVNIYQEKGAIGLMVLFSNNVTVRDAVFRHAYQGIKVLKSNNVQFYNVSVKSVDNDGIEITFSNQITMERVNVSTVGNFGIYMEQVTRSTIDQLFVSNTVYKGVYLWITEEINMTNSVISENKNVGLTINKSEIILLANLTMTANGGDGLYLENSFTLFLFDLTINFNGGNGINAQRAGTTAGSIAFFTLEEAVVTHNNLTGILLNYSDMALIQDSIIANNSLMGIEIFASESVKILRNVISSNGHEAISVDAESSNLLFQWNDVVTNTVNASASQAVDDGTDNLFDYNYWSDWTGPDSDNDYFVDHPYKIAGVANNKDPHPLTVRVASIHLLLPPIIIKPKVGDTFTSGKLQHILQIEWLPASDSLGHEITYDVYYSSNAGKSWNLIFEGIKEAVAWWNVTSMASGNQYRIKVVASDGADLTVEAIMDGTFTIDNSFFEETSGQGASLISFDGWYLGLAVLAMGSLILPRCRNKKK